MCYFCRPERLQSMKSTRLIILASLLVPTIASAQLPDSVAVVSQELQEPLVEELSEVLPEAQPDTVLVSVEVPSLETVIEHPDTLTAFLEEIVEEVVPVVAKEPEDKESLLARAAALRDVYDFAGARKIYEDVIADETDSTEIARIIAMKVLVDNGHGMMDYVMEPTVIARHRFSKNDFFLFYPLPEGSWVPSPNQLDPDSGRDVSAIYAPEGAERYVWSRKDEDSRNLYIIEKKDSVWTEPKLVSEDFSSEGNEIWPVLSADGKSLYFSSDGLYGLGGYDLYVSKLDERSGEWGVPVNLGFPFSSPADDFLYMDTPDERYTVFASNRACASDSVDVYVLAYEQMPVRKIVDDPVRLCGIAALNPVENLSRMDNGDTTEDALEDNADILRYMAKMEEVRSLRDSITIATRELNERRVDFATSDDADLRALLTESILKGEQKLPQLQSAYASAMSELQEIELDFLFKGVVIDPDKLMKKAEREVVGTSAAYTFSRMQAGKLPQIVFEEPEID